MTTIGTAVLQIIPSLKGVTEEIEKQLPKTPIEVKVAPKVDKPAAAKAGKDAAEAITKPIADAAKKAGTDAGKQLDQSMTKAAKDTGAKVGKTVTQEVTKATTGSSGGLKQAALDAAKEFEKGLVSGVTSGITTAISGGRLGVVMTDGLTSSAKDAVANSKIGETLGSQVTDKLIDGIADAFKGSSIGQTITGALNTAGVDIGGVVTPIIAAIDPLRASLEAFKTGDVGGGLSAAVQALKGLETVGVPSGLVDTLTRLADPIEKIASGNKAQKVQGVADGLIAMAPAISDMTGADLSGVTGNLEKISGVAGGVGELAGSLALVKTGAVALGGEAVVGSLGAFAAAAAPLLAAAAAIGVIGKFTYDWSVNHVDANLNKNTPFIPNSPVIPPGNPNAGKPVPGDFAGGKREPLSAGELYTYGAGKTVPASVPPPPKDQRLPGKAGGGTIIGAGGPMSDAIPIWASNGEYIVNAAAAQKNLALLEIINSGRIPGFKGGGQVALGNISGPGITSAEQQTMWDAIRATFPNAVLSSATRTVQTEGHPDFHNAGRAIDISGPSMDAIAAWIAQKYPDSLELIHAPFGHNIKNGKDVGDGVGLYGAKTMAGHHDHVHWALGHNAANAIEPSAPTSPDTASPASTAPAAAAPSSSGAGVSLPSSISGLSSFGLSTLGSGVGTTSSGSDLSKFGNAAASAVSGQVASALGVFGVGDAPPFLKAASMLVGGLKVGGHGHPGASDGSLFNGANLFGGGSAAPIAASPSGTGTLSPDDVHGTQAGQQPGPVTNIYAQDAEGALDKWQRLQDQRAAAKLSHL